MTDDKITFKNLKQHWERNQIKNVIAPVYEGIRVTPSISEILRALSHDEIIIVTETLWNDYVQLDDTRVCKKGVARIAGMTVSWLENSYCPTARELRAIGIRYGASQTSPLRFRRSLVQAICDVDRGEAGL